MTIDWTRELLEQFTWQWDTHLRPRLEGLTDAEYRWEPVDGCWSIRPRAEATTPMAVGAGDHVMDYAFPEPSPAPVTTIAWRIGHLLVGVLGQRNASYFGGPPTDYPTFDYPAGAQDALNQLDVMVARWVAGVQSLTPADLEKPCGEDGFESSTMAALVLHIHREMLHHGAEIALLRDLFTWRGQPAIRP
ncbi:hypothetical protein ABIB25_002397 [Nakamurella sp. UYEF19]|uniref:DinB family protein n=1 Tax=Nakamurella sp. UYEF19 TaxID=1756392 RepID=UPI003397E476